MIDSKSGLFPLFNYISGVYKVPYSPPLGMEEVYQTCWGRLSSYEVGKGISWLWGRI